MKRKRPVSKGSCFAADSTKDLGVLGLGPRTQRVISLSRALVRTNGHPDFAVERSNGNLYAVWADTRFSGGGFRGIAFSLSTDGGLSWPAPQD